MQGLIRRDQLLFRLELLRLARVPHGALLQLKYATLNTAATAEQLRQLQATKCSRDYI